MYIELFGLPGSGKTTLAKKLEKEGGFPRARNKEWKRAFRYMLRHPVITMYWIVVTFSETAKSSTWKILRIKYSLLFYTFAFLDKATTSKELMVVDEGMLQRMLSIFETKKEDYAVVKALRYIEKPLLYIAVKGDPQLYFKRYADETKDNVRAALGERYQKDWQEIVRHNHEALERVLKESGESMESYNWQKDSTEGLLRSLKDVSHGK